MHHLGETARPGPIVEALVVKAIKAIAHRGEILPSERPPAELLLACSIGEEQLEVHWDPGPLRYPPEMESEAEIVWRSACSAASNDTLLFDGPLCALQSYTFENGRLAVSLTQTSYRYVLFAQYRAEEIVRRWGAEYLPRVLGVSAVVVTTDGALPLMVRSDKVGEFPGYRDVFGGHIEPKADERGGKPDPFLAIRHELEEELKLRAQHISCLRCIGLIKSLCNQKPELVFVCHLTQDYRTLLRSATREPRCSEMETIVRVNDDAGSFVKFLESWGSTLTPSAYGCLWLYGLQRGFFSLGPGKIH